MEKMLDEQLLKNHDKVTAILNIMVESPYFYRDDAEELFLFLRRHRREFNEFFREYFRWELIMDEKCARVYKDKWYNEAITPGARLQFTLGGRDESIAFMLLIEFFEHQLEENGMTVEDKNNLFFTFGDWLEFLHRRFTELFPSAREKYTAEFLRGNVLRSLVPKLVRYRFLRELPKPPGMELSLDQHIYEALPALYHYNSGRLNRSITENDLVFTAPGEPEGEDETDTYTESAPEEQDAAGAEMDGLLKELNGDNHA